MSASPPPPKTASPPHDESHGRTTSTTPRTLPPPQAFLEEMQRPRSRSSVDSGYLTSGAAYANDAADARATSPPPPASGAGPTRAFALPKDPPKPCYRVRPTNPTPRPSNETRQACIPCRRKKVGCDLRHPGSDYDPPCKRCRADNLRCQFPGAERLPNGEAGAPQLPSLSQLACAHCSTVFLRDDELRQHLRAHCPEKPYVCATCAARFRRLNDLDRHTRIHTGERPHVCDICLRRFGRATTLTRHRQGADGCAGRRADLGRRRLGSFQGPPPPGPPGPGFGAAAVPPDARGYPPAP